MSSVALPGLWTPELWTPDKGWVPKLGSLKRFNRRIWERAKDETIVEAVAAANQTSIGNSSVGASQTLTITAPTAGNQIVVFAFMFNVSTAAWGITPQGTQAFTSLGGGAYAGSPNVNWTHWVSTNPGSSTSVVVVPGITAVPVVVICIEFSGITSIADAAKVETANITNVTTRTTGTYTPTVSDLLLGYAAESIAGSVIGSGSGWTAGPNTVSSAGQFSAAIWWTQTASPSTFNATFTPTARNVTGISGIKASVAAVSEPRIPLGNQAVMRAATR